MKRFLGVFLFGGLFGSLSTMGQGLVADNLEKQALLDLYFATTTNGAWVSPWNVTKLQDATKNLADFTTTDLPGVVIVNNDVSAISMYNNNVRGAIPATLANLSQLKVLEIPFSPGAGYNRIGGIVPNLGSLTNLEALNISSNEFTGSLNWLTTLTKLKTINLRNVSGSGLLTLNVNVSGIGWLDLTYLDLSGIRLTGPFHPNIGQLNKLTTLVINNCGLNANSFPSEFGGMTVLTYLDVSNNVIVNVPNVIGSLGNLNSVLMANCSLQSLPSTFRELDKLSYLNLSSNKLGFIPTADFHEIVNILVGCNVLQTLDLSDNSLKDVPANFDQLGALRTLVLNFNPISYGSHMKELSGSKITSLQCAHCSLTDSLPSSFLNLQHLGSLNLSNFSAGGLANNSLNLNSANVQGILTAIQPLTQFYASYNSISGVLPAWFGTGYMNQWQTLVLSNNQIQFPIPSNFQLMNKLVQLNLSFNSLAGTFPSYFSGFTSLKDLNLENNQLIYPLPDLSGCTALQQLRLTNNLFTGAIPDYFLTGLPNFSVLYIGYNGFTGIPNLSSRANRASLQLRLNNNKFDFVDLEPYFTGPGTYSIAELIYIPQQNTIVGDPKIYHAVEGTPSFPIDYSPGGTKNTYFWQRSNGSTWVNLSSSFLSNSTYAITPVLGTSEGSYRTLVRNSWVIGIDLTGNTVEVKLIPPLCKTPVSVSAGVFKLDKLTGAIVFDRNDCSANIPVSCIYGPSSGLPNVVSSKSVIYSDDWSYTFSGIASGSNPFVTGERGKWRAKASYAANTSINQVNDKNYNAGTFKYIPFNWKNGDKSGYPNWLLASKVEKYSPDGEAVEERNAIDIPSVAKFGYRSAVPYLIAQNAEYSSVLFESFENIYGSKFEDGFTENAGSRDTTIAHSGFASFKIAGAAIVSLRAFTVNAQIKSNGLMVRMWIRGLTSSPPAINLAGAATSSVISQLISRSGEWGLYQSFIDPAVFSTSLINASFTIRVQSTGSETIWLDDLRIQPRDAEMTTYVYDRNSLRLLTVFDDQHFGLFYQYNAEGKLMRKIIETERGLKTVQETQYNTPLVNKPN